MSTEAMVWSIYLELYVDKEIIEKVTPTMAWVLTCVGNYAGEDGEHAFPSIDALTFHTRLSERAVRKALRNLEELGLVRPGNQAYAALKYPADRRPRVYDLNLPEGFKLPKRGARHAPRKKTPRGAPDAPREEETGGTTFHHGGHEVPERGARGAPKPSYNPNKPERAPGAGPDKGPLRAALDKLKSEIGEGSYNAWFGQAKISRGKPFEIMVPTRFVQSRITTDYLDRLHAHLQAAGETDRIILVAERAQ